MLTQHQHIPTKTEKAAYILNYLNNDNIFIYLSMQNIQKYFNVPEEYDFKIKVAKSEITEIDY